MTVKITRRSNYNIDLRKLLSRKQNHPPPKEQSGLSMKNLPTLRNDSSFAVQFSISVSKTRTILLFKIKIKLIEMFKLNERMPDPLNVKRQSR